MFKYESFMQTLQTQRLLLRALTPEVYEDVFSTYSDEGLMQFFGCKSATELEEERKKKSEGLSMYRKTFLIFQLIEKESKKVVGWCGYHTWYFTHFRAEIGYMLFDDLNKGKGFMKEALPAVLNYGFQVMGLKRVEAFLSLENIPSLKLVTTLGFKQEGTLRDHYLKDGKLEDSTVFSLLIREYEEQPWKREVTYQNAAGVK